MLCCRWIDTGFPEFSLNQGYHQNVVEINALADQSHLRLEITNGLEGRWSTWLRGLILINANSVKKFWKFIKNTNIAASVFDQSVLNLFRQKPDGKRKPLKQSHMGELTIKRLFTASCVKC
jgi:hypothetical protein